MKSNVAHLCIGGNLGNRMDNLEETRMFIGYNMGEIVRTSPVFETEPWGMTDAPSFLNQVVEIRTELTPGELQTEILELEEFYGRKRSKEMNLSREMDVDILLFNDEIIHTEKLSIPHPRLHMRKFVLIPLCEIAPDQVHPELKKTMRELLDTCPDQSSVKLYS